MPPLSLKDKVRFLSRPGSYPEKPARVDLEETHMSWVFLTEKHAYKLKKPVRSSYLDYGTLEARQRNCVAELRLNRRFAPQMYLAVVPLHRDRSGALSLAGAGEPCEWLVKMVRLPAGDTLEAQIGQGAVDEMRLRRVVQLLVRVYAGTDTVEMSPEVYRGRFRRDLEENLAALADPAFALSRERFVGTAAALQRFLQNQSALLDARSAGGRIVEGHGDLRPQHVYLCDPPVILDCLEFNRELRLLDPLDELAYLAVECDRLGAPRLGDLVLETYVAETGDRPPHALIDFYAGARALLRAKLAIWHLRDRDCPQPEHWRARTLTYLDIAGKHAARLEPRT